MPGAGELSLLVNPEAADAQAGPGFLTRCFATRWTDVMYRWYLRRSFAGEAPDRLILTEAGRAVAGCGLVYRLLRTPEGAVEPVSVVVAACTLPSARGRGCYARVLQAAIDRSARRGCTALLGFVTADNATGRGLRRLGAATIASAYIASGGRPGPASAARLRLEGARASDGWRARAAAHLRSDPLQAGFHYPDASAWRAQMLERPHPVQSLRIGATCRAIVECVGDTDRLQWLDGDPRERLAAIRAVAAHARRRGRRFFMYSTRPGDVAGARSLGLAVRPGYMMALALRTCDVPRVQAWATMSWHVQSGDRM
ncbi:MAG TPA: GNAT family N-acetyltransferase [Steroidobacteraceae bacterium]|nr:GNAT family N-acetyltransferase [Steroidobacteraceae bacterium]